MIEDKGLNRELKELGISGKKHFMLTQDAARDMGVKCHDCWTGKVVYFISKPMGKVFEPGGYCYRCLVKRVKASRMIPYPIEENLLNSLKLELGIGIHTPPKYYI